MILLARTFHMGEFPRFVPPSDNLMGGGTLIRCTEKECRYDDSDSACRRSPLTLFHIWNLPHFTMAGKSAPLKTMAGQHFVTWLQRYAFMLKVELLKFDFFRFILFFAVFFHVFLYYIFLRNVFFCVQILLP